MTDCRVGSILEESLNQSLEADFRQTLLIQDLLGDFWKGLDQFDYEKCYQLYIQVLDHVQASR